MANYGTVNEGNAFFAARLHSYDWDQATVEDRLAALVQATELIDQFDYICQKYTVQVVLDDIGDGDPTTDDNKAALRAADLAQPLQFPRGSDSTTIPTDVETATYLIAKALLSGRDPEMDLEAMSSRGVSYGDLRTLYTRGGNLQEHITHLIPSPAAWNLLRPFLRERNEFNIYRV